MEVIILGNTYKEGEVTEHVLTVEEIKQLNNKEIQKEGVK